MPGRTRLLRIVVAAALTATSGLAFAPLVQAHVLIMVPLAAAGACVIAAARRRWTVLGAIVGWLLAGLPLAMVLGAGPAGILDTLRGGLLDGFHTALTAAPPLPATPAVSLWLFTLVWWTAYWTARAATADVTPLLTLLPPGLLLLLATGFAVAADAGRPPAAPLFAGLAVFLLAIRGGTEIRRLAVAAVLSAALVLGAVVVAARLPYAGTRSAFDPRALVREPQRIERQISPLALATLWAAQPARPLFQVATRSPVNQRLAVFDEYDGHEWQSDAYYVSTGTRLPAPGTPRGRTVGETVTVGTLPLVWLPAPDRPVTVTGTLVRADRGTGVLTTADGRAVAGRRYTVTSHVPVLTPDQAATAVPDRGTAYAAALAVPPGTPETLLRDADSLTQDLTAPYQRLLALENHLRTEYHYDVLAAPGRTVGHVRFFYEKSHRGTADQFATAFALMARHLGFPTRIVVGFTPGRITAPGRYEETTSDVVVWPEVALRGLGWVPFYPLPRPGAAGTTVGRSVGEPPDRAALDQAALAAARRDQANRPRSAGPIERPRPARGRSVYYWSAGAGLLAIMLLGYFLPGPIIRARARRRRRSGTPYERVVGAWQETTSMLARLPGADGLAALTAEEIAERSAEWLGRGPHTELRSLARHVSSAVFSPREPDEGDAEATWMLAARLRNKVDRRIQPSQRIREFARPPWAAIRAARRSG